MEYEVDCPISTLESETDEARAMSSDGRVFQIRMLKLVAGCAPKAYICWARGTGLRRGVTKHPCAIVFSKRGMHV